MFWKGFYNAILFIVGLCKQRNLDVMCSVVSDVLLHTLSDAYTYRYMYMFVYVCICIYEFCTSERTVSERICFIGPRSYNCFFHVQSMNLYYFCSWAWSIVGLEQKLPPIPPLFCSCWGVKPLLAFGPCPGSWPLSFSWSE